MRHSSEEKAYTYYGVENSRMAMASVPRCTLPRGRARLPLAIVATHLVESPLLCTVRERSSSVAETQ
jgi:hypothetical protein